MRVRINRGALPILLAATLLLGACTATGDSPASTTRTGDAPTTIASTMPSTTASTPPTDTTRRPGRGTTTTAMPDPLAESVVAQYGDFGPDLPIGASTSRYSGSGCDVDGDSLPDGYWFGHILEYEITAEDGTVEFDLACVENTGQNIVFNQTARLRQVSLAPDTRFVFVHDQVILSPGTDAVEITSRFGTNHDAGWGWLLLEDGVFTEFYIPGGPAWQNRTQHDTESTIPAILYPDPTSGQVLTAPDGFDGSGCTPQQGSLPDGLWMGTPRFVTPDRLFLDLACSVSDVDQMIRVGIDPGDVEDRTAIDDGDDAEYELAIAPDATLFMTSIDGNIFQTPLVLADPRYLHFVNGPQPAYGVYTPGLWVLVEDGVVVEGFNFFHP